MISILGLVLAALAGLSPLRLLLLVGVVYQPLVVVVVVVAFWWHRRPHSEPTAALFCESVAAELRAGSALRDAVTTAATSVGREPLRPEAPLSEVAASVAEVFPELAQEIRLVITSAARAGSDPAVLFDEMGAFALAKNEIASEVRMATTPGKATALVLIGAPVAYVMFQVGTGAFAEMFASSQQRTAGLFGLGLFGMGVLLAAVVLWRARS